MTDENVGSAVENLSTSGQLAERLALEEEVVGLLLKSPSLEFGTMLRDIGPPCSAYSQRTRNIVRAVLDLVARGEEFDISTLINLLEEQDKLKAAGGEEFLSGLAGKSMRPPEQFPSLIQQLRDIHHRDKLRTLLEMALGMVITQEHKPETVVNMLQEDLTRILENTEHDTARSVGTILEDLHNRTERGIKSGFHSYRTGFEAIDNTIGGISQGELILIGGAQGIGKTIMCLQMARNIALEEKTDVLYICYEHSPEYLLKRLIPLESINPVGVTAFDLGLTERDVLRGIDKASTGRVGFLDMLKASARGKIVLEKLLQYKDRLHLIKGDSLKTTLQAIRSMIIETKSRTNGQVVVFIDYLQKVPIIPEPAREEEKVTIITQSLKDMALSLQIPIVNVVAADREGLKAKRLHIFHLRGSSALDYESDIVIILNDKDKIISKNNVAYNPNKIHEYRQYVVATIEKNRTGRKMVDIEFRKHFKFFCFDPTGHSVQEQLIEEKLFTE